MEKTDAKIRKEKYLGPKIEADFVAWGNINQDDPMKISKLNDKKLSKKVKSIEGIITFFIKL